MQISEIRYKQLLIEKVELEKKLKEVNIEIKEAEKFGDFSENEELHAAKNKKSIILYRLDYINQTLQDADIVPIDDGPVITVGSLLRVKEITPDGPVDWGIKMFDNGDFFSGYLDPNSDCGKAIKGSVGGQFDTQTAMGMITFDIKKLSSSYIDEFIDSYKELDNWDFIK